MFWPDERTKEATMAYTDFSKSSLSITYNEKFKELHGW